MDQKDRRLLYELSRNSRMPANEIGKAVGLSRDAVTYRINALIKRGILRQLFTVVNLKKLGFRTHVIMLEFKRFELAAEQRVLSFLKSHPNTIWAVTSSGRWDVVIDIVSRDVDQFDQILTGILAAMQDNLKSFEVLETIKEHYYNHKFLTGQDAKQEKTTHSEYRIDATDVEILKRLSLDSRLPSTELALAIGVSHDQVSYRIKKLLQSGIIEQFTVLLDYSKLGMLFQTLYLQFNKLDTQTERRIVEHLKTQKEVLFLEKTAGKFNIVVDVIVDSPSQFRDFLTRLRGEFGSILEDREAIIVFEQHKNNYFPEGVAKGLYIS